jgi:hypothetical protein
VKNKGKTSVDFRRKKVFIPEVFSIRQKVCIQGLEKRLFICCSKVFYGTLPCRGWPWGIPAFCQVGGPGLTVVMNSCKVRNNTLLWARQVDIIARPFHGSGPSCVGTGFPRPFWFFDRFDRSEFSARSIFSIDRIKESESMYREVNDVVESLKKKLEELRRYL